MSRLPNFHHLFILLGVIIGSVQLTAETDYLDYRGELRSWPSSPRPRMEVEIATQSDGENNSQSFVLSGAGMNLIMPFEEGLFEATQGTRYSASFRHRLVPDFILGISVFNKGAFLNELNDDGIRGYLKALLVRLPRDVKITVISGPDDKNSSYDYPLLGRFPHQVVYDTIDEKTGVILRRGEYFVEINDRLIVVTYENSPAMFAKTQGFIFPVMARMYLH